MDFSHHLWALPTLILLGIGNPTKEHWEQRRMCATVWDIYQGGKGEKEMEYEYGNMSIWSFWFWSLCVAKACEETSMCVLLMFIGMNHCGMANRFGVVGGYLLLRICFCFFNTTDVVQYT